VVVVVVLLLLLGVLHRCPLQTQSGASEQHGRNSRPARQQRMHYGVALAQQSLQRQRRSAQRCRPGSSTRVRKLQRHTGSTCEQYKHGYQEASWQN
jgi:hypothetical protein